MMLTRLETEILNWACDNMGRGYRKDFHPSLDLDPADVDNAFKSLKKRHYLTYRSFSDAIGVTNSGWAKAGRRLMF